MDDAFSSKSVRLLLLSLCLVDVFSLVLKAKLCSEEIAVLNGSSCNTLETDISPTEE